MRAGGKGKGGQQVRTAESDSWCRKSAEMIHQTEARQPQMQLRTALLLLSLPAAAGLDFASLAVSLKARIAGDSSHRQLQGSAGAPVYIGTNCVRNCQSRLCNASEVKQANWCSDTCACGKYQVGPKGGEANEPWDEWEEWMPQCTVGANASVAKPVKAQVDSTCQGSRVTISGLMHTKANGEYRTSAIPAGEKTQCSPAAGKGTIYKQRSGDLYLYREVHPHGGEQGWYISKVPCSTYKYFARLSSDEGANIGMMPIYSGCQHGFEGVCSWRECTDKSLSADPPTCIASATPSNNYGFLRAPYNRAAYVRQSDTSPYAYRKCLGDFNEDKNVDVMELMEILAGFGISSCAVRADLDRNCVVDVHDLLLILSHFGKCGLATTARVKPYQLSKLIISGFKYSGANGGYELQRVTCKGFPSRIVYKQNGGKFYLFPSAVSKSKVSRWLIGEVACRDDLAYAYIDVGKKGQELGTPGKQSSWTLPCEQGDKAKACKWQECSKAQFRVASCRMDCKPGEACPPLVQTAKSIEVIPAGTHSSGSVVNDVGR